jgi:hypothetical protein
MTKKKDKPRIEAVHSLKRHAQADEAEVTPKKIVAQLSIRKTTKKRSA